MYLERESIWYKLPPMYGARWIHDILAILDHFAIWARYETCQENKVLIFLAHNVKYKGERGHQSILAKTFDWRVNSQISKYLANLAI